MCLIRINPKSETGARLINSSHRDIWKTVVVYLFFHSTLRHNKGHFFQITPQVDTDANPIVTFKVTGILYFTVLAFIQSLMDFLRKCPLRVVLFSLKPQSFILE